MMHRGICAKTCLFLVVGVAFAISTAKVRASTSESMADHALNTDLTWRYDTSADHLVSCQLCDCSQTMADVEIRMEPVSLLLDSEEVWDRAGVFDCKIRCESMTETTCPFAHFIITDVATELAPEPASLLLLAAGCGVMLTRYGKR